jgi:hypothetical protein
MQMINIIAPKTLVPAVAKAKPKVRADPDILDELLFMINSFLYVDFVINTPETACRFKRKAHEIFREPCFRAA